MVVVVALSAVLLGVGAHSMRQALLREEIDGRARAVLYDLSAAQQAAVTRRSTVTVTFQNSAYTVADGGSTLVSGNVPSHITFGSTATVLTFNRRGVPGGTLALTIGSSAAGRTYSITVDAGTGRASSYAY